MSNNSLSIIFIHYSDDEIKSYIGLNCLYRLRKVVRYMRKRNPTQLIVVNNGTKDREEMSVLCDVYIESDKNSLGHARNLGYEKATGEYVCFMDNDIYVDKPFWGECIEFLENHKDRKLITSPIHTSCHMIPKYSFGEIDGWQLNSLSGSNCLLMHRTSFEDIGRFPETFARARDGVLFARRQSKKGYLVALTRIGLARDIGIKNHAYHYDTTSV